MNSQPENNNPPPKRPTPEDLAGIPVCVNTPVDYTIRPQRAATPNIKPRADKNQKPTTEDLAGIPACAEVKGATFRPRKRPPEPPGHSK
jgi:hypothetical protein